LDNVPEPDTVNKAEDRETFKNRMVGDTNDFGLHIDAAPASRTPLAYMTNPPKKEDMSLSDSVPGGDYQNGKKHTQFGSQTPGKKGIPAMTGDIPQMPVDKTESASQVFETTAVALEGVQKGMYYGSVKWGWTKQAGKEGLDAIDEIPFGLAKEASPSPSFFKAAKQWNASQDSAGEASIPLPMASDKIAKAHSELMNGPTVEAERLVRLDHDTRVGVFEDTRQGGMVKVIVTKGNDKAERDKGTIGWIKESQLSETETPSKKKK
jgi:hypothetical protein